MDFNKMVNDSLVKMDFNKMVDSSLVKMEKNGEVQKLIDRQVALAVESVVKDLFGTESAFSFKLNRIATEALQINFNDLDLASYNHMILQAIKDKLVDGTNDGVEQIKTEIESLLTNTKREYKVSELIEELSHEITNKLDYEERHEMTLIVNNQYDSYFVHMDSRKGVSDYECKYVLHISGKGNLLTVRINDQERIWKDTVTDFDVRGIMNGLYGLEKTLFKIYTSRAKIIIDESNCQLEISKTK
ncbi:hypothetical protein [Listeria welshimeri]|uniref:hypothetical protein n=1 Tax=Listeria welshimeri TaxID=1643 RepID=UPI001E54C574|nr:hypothetical protein [Listeria welshimeri]